MAYIDISYKNSAAYHSVMGATNRAQLLNCKPYYVMAIEFHKMEGNEGQVAFFTEGLALVEKRLTKLAPDLSKAAEICQPMYCQSELVLPAVGG